MGIYKPHWKGPIPYPNIEVYAAPTGGVQWSCPDCGNLHSQDGRFWRKAQLLCARNTCKRRFRMGVGFSKTQKQLCMYMGAWAGNKANRLNAAHILSHVEPVGRVFGKIAWICPDCSHFQNSEADFHVPSVDCEGEGCGSHWYLQLLIYKPAGPKVIVPFDWTPYYAPSPYNTDSPKKAS